MQPIKRRIASIYGSYKPDNCCNRYALRPDKPYAYMHTNLNR